MSGGGGGVAFALRLRGAVTKFITDSGHLIVVFRHPRRRFVVYPLAAGLVDSFAGRHRGFAGFFGAVPRSFELADFLLAPGLAVGGEVVVTAVADPHRGVQLLRGDRDALLGALGAEQPTTAPEINQSINQLNHSSTNNLNQ